MVVSEQVHDVDYYVHVLRRDISFLRTLSLTLSFSISFYFSVGSLPPQCKQHEVRDGCDKSAEDPDAEGLRKAAADATGAFAAATTQRGSGREPKKMSRTRAEAAEQEGGAAPPSPNRRTAKALRANAAEGAAADVVATSAQLAVTNARLEAELVRLKEQLREAEAEIQNLGGVRRSSLSAESMRTDREAEKEAKFDVSFLSTFNLDLSAERQQLSRGVQRVHLALLSACTPARGTRARQLDPLRASVGKRAQVVQSVLEGWLQRAGGDYSAVLSSLPKSLFDAFETYQYNEGRLRDALAVLKYGRSGEDRLNYSVLSTAVAAEVVAERDQRGMGRRVAASYGIPRDANSVPARQRLVRAAWDEAVNNKSPLQPGDKIICRNGIGVIETFGSGVGERSVTIKFEHKRKIFTSLGQPVEFMFCASCPSIEFTVFPCLAKSVHFPMMCSYLRHWPRWRAGAALSAVVASPRQGHAQRQAERASRGRHPRVLPGPLRGVAVHEGQGAPPRPRGLG